MYKTELFKVLTYGACGDTSGRSGSDGRSDHPD